MPGNPENIELLKKHLDEHSLAYRLVTKYGSAKNDTVNVELDSVLQARFAEVRDAIEHAANKLG